MPKKGLTENPNLVKLRFRPSSDLTGRTFGEWTVLEYAGHAPPSGPKFFRCRCSCGNVVLVNCYQLQNGKSMSCGHNGSTYKHGCARRSGLSPMYRLWRGIMNRCHNRNTKEYKDYGGRGIVVCERWQDFTKFVEDMGERPSKSHTVGRRDNYGHYGPDNCRWETMAEQGRNKRNNRVFEYLGERMCITDIARAVGINIITLRYRVILLGWSVEKAVNTPVGRQGKGSRRPDTASRKEV